MQHLLDLATLVSYNDGRSMMKTREGDDVEEKTRVKCNGDGCNYTSLVCPWRSWRLDIAYAKDLTTTPYMWIVNEESILCRFCFDRCKLKWTKTYRPYWSPSSSSDTAIDDVVMHDLLVERGYIIE